LGSNQGELTLKFASKFQPAIRSCIVRVARITVKALFFTILKPKPSVFYLSLWKFSRGVQGEPFSKGFPCSSPIKKLSSQEIETKA